MKKVLFTIFSVLMLYSPNGFANPSVLIGLAEDNTGHVVVRGSIVPVQGNSNYDEHGWDLQLHLEYYARDNSGIRPC